MKNGTTRTFTHEIKNHKKLGETIVQETTKQFLPNAIEAFDKGQTVTVYDLTLFRRKEFKDEPLKSR